jgi:hypothetical protein
MSDEGAVTDPEVDATPGDVGANESSNDADDSARLAELPQPTGPGKRPGKPDPATADDAEDSSEGGIERDQPEERGRQSYLDRVDDEERDWFRRQQNLRDLDGEQGSGSAGRDWIRGDRVSGDGKVYNVRGNAWFYQSAGADRETPILYMQHNDVEQLRTCLVAPPGQTDLQNALGRWSLVFLRGAEGTGRRVAALDALLTWANASVVDEETSNVGLIMAKPPFRDPVPDLRKGCGYVLETSSVGGGAWDMLTFAENLRHAAEKRECRIVIIVSSDRSSLPGHVVDHSAPHAPAVFDCWLKYEAEQAGIDSNLLDEMRPEIDNDLQRVTSPVHAVNLARALIYGLRNGRTLEELRAELPTQRLESVRHRLAEDKPVLGRCFLTSVAVLNGVQESQISRAALNLAEKIKSVRSIKTEAQQPAWEKLDTWLDYAAASISPQKAGGGRVVRLKRPEEKETLQVLWEDHPSIREPVIGWLKDLVKDIKQRDVQIKAAHAAGIIATFDFDIAKEAFLDPWASSHSYQDHRCAGMMLEFAAGDADVLPRVHELLRKFAHGTRRESLVAAHAYGSRIGLYAPEIALRYLRNIAFGRDIEVSKIVANSVGNLYWKGTAERIIREIANWVVSESSSGSYTAALVFLRLARIARGNPDFPALIELNPSDRLYGQLSLLWQVTLEFRIRTWSATNQTYRSELAIPDSWTILARWVSQYDEEPAVRSVIDRVLADSDAGSGHLRKALFLNLRRWEHRKLINQDLRERLFRLMRGE